MFSRSKLSQILILSLLLGAADKLWALTYSQPLDFHAPTQSMWGPGGNFADFHFQGNTGGSFGVEYEARASTGTVAADYNGVLSVNYSASRQGPGLTYLGIGFAGDADGGFLDTYLGASLDVDWYVNLDVSMPWPIPDIHVHEDGNIYSKNYALDIEKRYTPRLDTSVRGTDTLTVAGISAGVGVVDVGLDFDIEQTANFTANAIKGSAVYNLRGSGATNVTPFTIESNSRISLPINLDKVGLWDIYFTGLDLSNAFYTGFDLDLTPFIEVDLLVWDNRWGWTLDGLDLYDSPTFALAFNRINGLPIFSIYVPEPSTMLLLSSGLLGLIWFGRKGFSTSTWNCNTKIV